MTPGFQTLLPPGGERFEHSEAGADRLAALLRVGSATPSVRAVFNRSLDGAVTGRDGLATSLRSPEDTFVFGVLRALADVVVAGAGTARAEDYGLPNGRRIIREQRAAHGQAPRPALAVLTRTGIVPDALQQACDRIVLLTPRSSADRVRARVPEARVLLADSPAEAVLALAEQGWPRIHLEGGPTVMAQWLASGCVDELLVTTTFRTVGGDAPRMADGAWSEEVWRPELVLLGRDAMFERYVRS